MDKEERITLSAMLRVLGVGALIVSFGVSLTKPDLLAGIASAILAGMGAFCFYYAEKVMHDVGRD